MSKSINLGQISRHMVLALFSHGYKSMGKDAYEAVGTKEKKNSGKKGTLDRIQCVYGISVHDSLFDFSQCSIVQIFIQNSNSSFFGIRSRCFFFFFVLYSIHVGVKVVSLLFFFSLWKSIPIFRRENKIYHKLPIDQLNGHQEWTKSII